MWKTATVLGCLLFAAAAARAQPKDAAEDDLALVKRAVGDDSAPVREARRETPTVEARGAVRDGAKPAARPGQARWFRIRIDEAKGSKVRVNLPLAIVRGLGDVPLDWGCGRAQRKCQTLRLEEILDQLEEGQDLVEIKDTDSTVRIWVD